MKTNNPFIDTRILEPEIDTTEGDPGSFSIDAPIGDIGSGHPVFIPNSFFIGMVLESQIHPRTNQETTRVIGSKIIRDFLIENNIQFEKHPPFNKAQLSVGRNADADQNSLLKIAGIGASMWNVHPKIRACLLGFGLAGGAVAFSYFYNPFAKSLLDAWPLFWIPAGILFHSVGRISSAIFEQKYNASKIDWTIIIRCLAYSALWGPIIYFGEIGWLMPVVLGNILHIHPFLQGLGWMILISPIFVDPAIYWSGRRLVGNQSTPKILPEARNKLLNYVGLNMFVWIILTSIIFYLRSISSPWVFCVQSVAAFGWGVVSMVYFQGREPSFRKLKFLWSPFHRLFFWAAGPRIDKWETNFIGGASSVIFGYKALLRLAIGHRYFGILAFSDLYFLTLLTGALAAHLIFGLWLFTGLIIGTGVIGWFYWLRFKSGPYIMPEEPKNYEGFEWAAATLIALAEGKAAWPGRDSTDLARDLFAGDRPALGVAETGFTSLGSSNNEPRDLAEIMENPDFQSFLKVRVADRLKEGPSLETARELAFALYSLGVPQGSLNDLTSDIVLKLRAMEEDAAGEIKKALMTTTRAQSVTLWVKNEAEKEFLKERLTHWINEDGLKLENEDPFHFYNEELFRGGVLALEKLEANLPSHLRKEKLPNVCLIFFEAIDVDLNQISKNAKENDVRVMILNQVLSIRVWATLGKLGALEAVAKILSRQA